MNEATSPKQVLIAARWILDNIGWTQTVMIQRDQQAKPIAFCSLGAFDQVLCSYDDYVAAKDILRQVIDAESIAWWNDEHGRTKQQILHAFDKAIEEAS